MITEVWRYPMIRVRRLGDIEYCHLTSIRFQVREDPSTHSSRCSGPRNPHQIRSIFSVSPLNAEELDTDFQFIAAGAQRILYSKIPIFIYILGHTISTQGILDT